MSRAKKAKPRIGRTKSASAAGGKAKAPSRRSHEATLDMIGGLFGDGDGDAGGRTPLDAAQQLIYDAWEAPTVRKAVELARKALTSSPDCADAYVLLAQDAARDPGEALELYAKGVAAGERALGKRAFKRDVGYFWGLLETRPYMRARAGLAQTLWEFGRHQEAIHHYQ